MIDDCPKLWDKAERERRREERERRQEKEWARQEEEAQRKLQHQIRTGHVGVGDDKLIFCFGD